MIIDLSHPMTQDMPVFPGTEQPELRVTATVEKNGFYEKKLTFYSHTGTHMDAPAHMIRDGKTLDRIDINHFHGSALVLDFRDAGNEPDALIRTAALTPFEDRISGCDYLLLHTGWYRFWGTPEYFDHFPVLTPGAAQWLTRFDLKGIGLDTISADKMDSRDYPVHHTLLGNDMVIVENLTNLDKLPADRLLFSCFPIPLAQADGSPVRAVAQVDTRRKKESQNP